MHPKLGFEYVLAQTLVQVAATLTWHGDCPVQRPPKTLGPDERYLVHRVSMSAGLS